jgi:hypothetical protein
MMETGVIGLAIEINHSIMRKSMFEAIMILRVLIIPFISRQIQLEKMIHLSETKVLFLLTREPNNCL